MRIIMALDPWKTGLLIFLCIAAAIGAAACYRMEDRSELDFAPTVSVPDGYAGKIMLVHKDGTTSEHDGEQLYSEHFLNGWNECKRSFVNGVQWGDTKAWLYATSPDGSDLEAPWIIGAPDEINNARRDGWQSCRQRIQEHLEIHSEASLREKLSLEQGM